MAKKTKLAEGEQGLVRRYLIWCYKTTKEELDKIDRKFTQVMVDEKVLALLEKRLKAFPATERPRLAKFVGEFRKYLADKQGRAVGQKFELDGKTQRPEYSYLRERVCALEQVITDLLGPAELKIIRQEYEREMTRRILESRGSH